MSNFPLMRRLKKFLFHNAILVYAGSLPQASLDCQRPLALLANSMLKETLRRAQKRYQKQVNNNRRHLSFKVGQKVWLNVNNFTLPQGLTPKFMAKFAGPFPVVK